MWRFGPPNIYPRNILTSNPFVHINTLTADILKLCCCLQPEGKKPIILASMWMHRLPDHLNVFPAEKKIVFPLKQSSLTAGQHKYVLEWKLTIKVNSSKATWCLNWLGQATTLSAVADMKSLLSSGKCSTSHTNTCTSWGKISTHESLLLHISSRHKNTTRADAAHQAHGCPLQVERYDWHDSQHAGE